MMVILTRHVPCTRYEHVGIMHTALVVFIVAQLVAKKSRTNSAIDEFDDKSFW
jgi:hypothetical protein